MKTVSEIISNTNARIAAGIPVPIGGGFAESFREDPAGSGRIVATVKGADHMVADMSKVNQLSIDR